MSINITVSLLKTNPNASDDARKHFEEHDYIEQPTREDIDVPEGMTLLSKQHDPKVPPWVPWTASVFQLQEPPSSASTGAVLFLESGDRHFVVTFGSASNTLPREVVERDFGIRCVMQLVAPERVRLLATKSMGLRSKEKTVYNQTGDELGSFGIDREAEWLREAAGPVVDGATFGFAAVQGKDSIRLVSYTLGIDELADTCATLLTLFEAEVPEAFRFFENLRPIDRHDALHTQLEDQLLESLQKGQYGRMTVVLDQALAEALDDRELKQHKTGVTLDDITDPKVWSGLAALATKVGTGFDVTRVRLVLNAADKTIDKPLIDYIQAEITKGGDLYLRLDGAWFRATSDYVASVDAQLAAEVPDLTKDLALPQWDTRTHPVELDYNTWVAGTNGWLLQDQNEVQYSGYQSVEPCDILTPEGQWIHLKDASGSQSVSALVGQLRGAAYLLQNDSKFRAEMAKRYEDKFGVDELMTKPAAFIMAFARAPHLTIFGDMLVAKVNTLDCGRRVRAFGFGFGVCKVARVEAPAVKKTPKKVGRPKKKAA